MINVVTKSAEDTRELGAALAGLARAGDVVLLAGDLGAGKTTLVQGFARGLGISEPVVSPTFILVRTYRGRLTLVHADAYRMDNLREVTDLDLPELLDDGGVAVVEWGDVIAPVLPADYLDVHLELGEGDDERSIGVRVVGPSWSPRAAALHAALERWSA
ncbi:MAG TPA: tRNA (adenosine(37)-N6)-threonylcarbamoyltransferase complex ATPase subunit type 1 TsaE [Acidimicrobiales bacterium]|nr:tRNA (adenosine(37)-N6)-threonylcarbamoyltransferase complex ATPase subunit type 1 TsaE [Acidimicrobiales bacterium]